MAMLRWEFLHPKMTLEHLGLIPAWLNDNDARSLIDQCDDHYHFGGFRRYPIANFKHQGEYHLKYPGDPVLKPLAKATLRDETIVFYRHALLAVFNKDGSFIVSRFD